MTIELPPLNIDDFNRFKVVTAIIKECDMDESTTAEAKEHIITGIEKCTGADGLDKQAACQYIKTQMDR